MTESTPPRPKRRRVALIVTALVVAVGLAGGGVAFGVSSAADRASARAFDDASTALAAARTAHDDAVRLLATAVEKARAEHARAVALSEVVDTDMVEDAALKTALDAAAQRLSENRDLTDPPPSPATATAENEGALPDSRAERTAAAKRANDEAAALSKEAEALEERAKLVDDASQAVRDAGTALIASAHAKATSLEAPGGASQESRDAFAAAVAALEAPEPAADLAALVQQYQDTWTAVVASDAGSSFPAPPGGSGSGPDQPTYIDGVLIANKTYALPSWYGNGLTPELLTAFNAMRAAAAADGISLWIVSGFRSYATQVSTYNHFVATYGQAFADTTSARPGHSEHQTGLAIDINLVDQSFGSTAEGIWVRENAHRFGFVIRYPQGKEHITGYMWEPWHLRYLGTGLATTLKNSGLTLEEHFGITSQYQ